MQGIVFAPLNKHALRLAGMTHEDELRWMAERLGVDGFTSEFNITGDLWTSRVTSHVPLREVADAITGAGVIDAVRIVQRYLVAAGIAAPRIAVAALNPHAGDGGSLGREEIDVIAPAIESVRREGIDARGPLPSDTVFVAAKRGDYDAVVSMYHDQGQIAMKLMGFDRGVTLHGGLPVPVATCASGTAFDIVGRGIANVEGPAGGVRPRDAHRGAQRSQHTRPDAIAPSAARRRGVRVVEEQRRIDHRAIEAHRPVQVRSGRAARRADRTDHVSRRRRCRRLHRDRVEVADHRRAGRRRGRSTRCVPLKK